MRIFIVIFFTAFTISCTSDVQDKLGASPISYQDWQKDAAMDIRLFPKYGDIPKSDGHKKADAQLMETVKKQFGNLDSASNAYFLRGCDYLNRDDLKTAMYRFNQAWLMNPKNPDVFRGFGYVYTRLGDHRMALKLYNEGLIADPKNEDLILEKSFAEKELQKIVK